MQRTALSALLLSAFGSLACTRENPAPAPVAAAPAQPTAPVATAPTPPDEAEAGYPAEPTAPPPVAPPAGKGLELKLERYIVVDQFGYRPGMKKVAVLADPQAGWNAKDAYTPGKELEVRAWADDKSVFRGPVTAWKAGAVDTSAGDRGAWFDFSSVDAEGTYYVFDSEKRVRSHPFVIGKDAYKNVLKAAMRAFYFNRANFEKKPPYSCVGDKCWSLGVDYMGEGQDKEARSVTDRENAKTARDLSGGWWDAGDTGKYVTFSNDAFHQLLTAYEEKPAAFTDDFGIPESKNGIPDLIDEVLVELAWLKKMQPADLKGGGLIKLANAEYGDPVPDQSKFRRYYYAPACSAATIVLAGEFAHAALVLKTFPKFAGEVRDLTKRARDAFAHYQANPKNDACDDLTLKSGDADRTLADQDKLAVASAVYLYALTSDRAYGEYVQKNYQKTRPFEGDWSLYDQDQGDALLYYAALPSADPATRDAIRARKKAQAATVDYYGFKPELDLYRAYMRTDSYHWGSNNVRASYGNTNYDLLRFDLVKAEERASYEERIAGMLHSYHGVNPMQLVYLTNMYAYGGDACADEAYHTWFRDKDPKWDNARTSTLGPAPGYVTGGANKNYCDGQDPKQHACARSPLRRQPAEKAYLDSNTSYDPPNQYDKSWELTEPAIYYQASYVRLLSKFVD
jgi:endoglucanase